ncbi:YdhK family protein [Paenibacillus sp.]|uniref:YdhK family protein n=1 Tax=Paenibacillus sp. TaxID=58172 RepID=UPI002D726FD9|nr:YdhK family protein [Paenibacillus sp.]HZG86864.1 YdhK family protein [Paenibacillus sp.]
MVNRRWMIGFAAAVMLATAGCGAAAVHNGAADDGAHGGHAGHSGSGEVPEGLQPAANPMFPVGGEAVIVADHMPGMKGAAATISGAYNTTAYAVSYTPTTGGERVEAHKWVVHEEIRNAREQPYAPGDTVVLEAEHMEGMKGAEAVIDAAEWTTVYMVDFVPTTGGEPVKNHKWVTEAELKKK